MSMNYLQNRDYLVISTITNETRNNLKLLKNNAIINIKPSGNALAYLEKVQSILDCLKYERKHFSVKIYISNRELLRKTNFLSTIPKNVNLIICCNDYEYQVAEYLQEEEKLEKLAKPIRESNLSPLEKLIAVYDLVKKFRPYKDNKNNTAQSRNLKYILEDNNEYIVCVGFANLLHELLTRVGIPNICIHADIDESYDDGYTQEEKPLSLLGHTRNLVRIEDKKYHVRGYYLTDTTWDNHPKFDLYLNSLLTFDRKKEAKRLESLEDIDLLLDFHSIDEFIKKIKFYIKHKISLPNIDTASEEKLRTKCYRDLYLKIINILKATDEQKYQELYSKYNNKLNVDLEKTNSLTLEPIMTSFLKEYAKYIIPLSNNEVSIETILRAAIVVKKELYKMSDDDIKVWLRQTLKDNQTAASIAFPYIYNPNNQTEAFVETRNKR